MWVSPKRRERGKSIWGVRPFFCSTYGEDSVDALLLSKVTALSFYTTDLSVLGSVATFAVDSNESRGTTRVMPLYLARRG